MAWGNTRGLVLGSREQYTGLVRIGWDGCLGQFEGLLKIVVELADLTLMLSERLCELVRRWWCMAMLVDDQWVTMLVGDHVGACVGG